MDNARARWPLANENAASAAFAEYRLEKILYQHKNDFIDDFSYADIHSDMQRNKILPPEMLSAIKTMKLERERIEYLFFLLVHQASSSAFTNFILILKDKYEWLSERLYQDFHRMESNNATTDDDYHGPIARLRREIPKHVDFNVHRCKFLWTLRQQLLSLERHQYLVVRGSLSFGKQWIVMDACCSYEVMHKMNGKIFWINCSKCKAPENILQQLEKLAILTNQIDHTMMTNYKDIQNKIVMLNEKLRHVFEKNAVLQNSLVVLIDVQNHDTLKAFDLDCKVLITTRNKRLLEYLSRTTLHVEVNTGFTRDECLELFSKMLDVSIDQLPPEANDLHRICRANPFIISRIASNLKEYLWEGKKCWEKWRKILENYESTKFDEFRKPIEQSLRAIRDIEHLYHSLVIFTDNVNIPISVLRKYWNLESAKVEAIIQRLDKLYLLERVIIGTESYCSLHYHYYSYLTNLIKAETKQGMHAQLVGSYQITEALRERTEPNITGLPDDKYLHFYIGYHLKESGLISLFPELYFDFGFVEQKLRYTGLPNTLGDFNSYKTEIADQDPSRIGLLEDLTDFLANIEEILLRTPHTCLLQYALTTDNAIREEAMRQARKFPNRIWFTDIDHSVKYRQIVELPEQPRLIRFVEPNSSLVAFADNTILLTDMSSEYTVEPTVYRGHDCTIRDLQLIHEDYFGSLDVKGSIKIWSLKETEIQRRRRSRIAIQIRARQKFPSTSECARKSNSGRLVQTLDEKIRCFIVHHREDRMSMFAATESGKIAMYEWNEEKSYFRLSQSKSFETHMERINKLIVIPELTIMMIINEGGTTEFFNLRDHAKTSRTSRLTFPTEPPINVHALPPDVVRNPATLNGSQTIAVVYPQCVYQITISHVGQVLLSDMIEAYRTTNEQNFLTCSMITDDRKYLILGTKKGIIVFDPMLRREILRSSVSENITCIDVYTLDDEIYRYILISATKKGGAVINVQGIQFKDDVVAWATNRIGSPLNGVNIGALGSINAWLIGGKAFDVIQEDDGSYTLVAADSKSLLHCISSSDSFNASTECCNANNTITAVTIGATKRYYGCANGTINEFNNPQPLSQLNGSVEYLKYYEQFDILIAGTSNYKKIFVPRKDLGFDSQLVLATFPFKERFIILVNTDCSFEILSLSSNQMKRISSEEIGARVNCAAIVEDRIIIGLKQAIHVFKINESADNEGLEIKCVARIETQSKDEIKSLAATTDDTKLLIAVGYTRGAIELYDVTRENTQMIQRLICHKEPVNCLVFSPSPSTALENGKEPNTAPGKPIILASISAEICFWDITQAVNNPMERDNQLRQSQRYRRKPNQIRVDTQVIHTNGNVIDGNASKVVKGRFGNRLPVDNLLNANSSYELDAFDPWIGKTGTAEKLELLSCIKFVGSSAEKLYVNQAFDTFITVDNEGVIYFFRAKNQFNEI